MLMLVNTLEGKSIWKRWLTHFLSWDKENFCRSVCYMIHDCTTRLLLEILLLSFVVTKIGTQFLKQLALYSLYQSLPAKFFSLGLILRVFLSILMIIMKQMDVSSKCSSVMPSIHHVLWYQPTSLFCHTDDGRNHRHFIRECICTLSNFLLPSSLSFLLVLH